MTRQDASMDFENRVSQQDLWPSQFRAIPTAGDVLASRPTARADTHDISIVPAAAHVTARRYSEAMEKVRELARASGVDGWFTSDTHYTRVATHRARDGAADDSQPSAAATTATHTHGVSNGATD